MVRTAGMKKVSNKGDTTNWSSKLHKITEIIHKTICSYRINHLPEVYNEFLLRPTVLTLEKSQWNYEKTNGNY